MMLLFFWTIRGETIVEDCCPNDEGQEAGRMTRSAKCGWIYVGI